MEKKQFKISFPSKFFSILEGQSGYQDGQSSASTADGAMNC